MKKKNTLTTAGTVGACLAVILIIGFMSYVRLGHNDNVKRVAKAVGMSILSKVDGYEANKDYLDLRADLAHDLAFKKAVNAVPRRRDVGFESDRDFDKNTYLAAFFEDIINQARNDGRQNLVNALMALCDRHDIQRPVTPS